MGGGGGGATVQIPIDSIAAGAPKAKAEAESPGRSEEGPSSAQTRQDSGRHYTCGVSSFETCLFAWGQQGCWYSSSPSLLPRWTKEKVSG